MRIAGIEDESIVDGPGIRFVVFAQGCNHGCVGCHNPEALPFEGGVEIEIDDILDMLDENPLLDGLTFSGGEPFEQAKAFAALANRAKQKGLNIITYTGYTYEELLRDMDSRVGWKELLDITDILIDGPFDISQKSMLLKFRGSRNQRIIDMKKSRESGEVVLAEL